jgi:hypothetical protein
MYDITAELLTEIRTSDKQTKLIVRRAYSAR